MNERAMTRRGLLQASVCTLAATTIAPEMSRARVSAGLSPKTALIVRKYYAAWSKRNWRALDMLLADDFTFSSPNDDHDSKAVYKARCWEPNVNLIENFDLQEIAGNANDAFVMYVADIKGGKTIRNVEYFRVRAGKVRSVRCYFGQQNSYPAAVTREQG
jgi:ketosteroid isomerase-like protein